MKLTVIASHAPTLKLLRSAALASFQCPACSNETVAMAGTEPFCSHCGNPDQVERTMASASVLANVDSDALTSVECSHCLVSNVIPDVELAQVERSADGHVEMCCVECGTGLKFNPDVVMAGADDESDDEESEDEDGNGDGWAWDGQDPEEAAADDDAEDGDEILDDDEESVDDDVDAEGDEDWADDEEEASSHNPMIVVPKGPPVESASADDEESEDEGEEEEDDMSDSEQADVIQSTQNPDIEDDIEPVAELNVDVLECMTQAGLSEDATLMFVPMGDKILANVNDTTVAVLTKTDATPNADIFGLPAYMEALTASFEQDGLDQTLAGYGFTRNSIKAPAAVAKAYAVAKAEAETAAVAQDAQAKYRDHMAQCLQLASAGMTRGMFTQHKHVVRDALVAEMATVGVKNAGQLVDRVLAQHEDAHNSNLLALAHSLSQRSADALNDLAETVASVAPAGSRPTEQASVELDQALESSMQPRIQTTASLLPQQPAGGNKLAAERLKAGSGRLFGNVARS